MINVEMEVSSELKKLLSPNNEEHVKRVLKNAQVKLADDIVVKIQEPGFAPRDTGEFAESHYSISNEHETVIMASKKVKNGTPLSQYIINGHRTLTTEKSRRWWFWYLNNVLGGSYTRKTSGPPGYVPPDRYHERAVKAVSINAIVQTIERELLH